MRQMILAGLVVLSASCGGRSLPGTGADGFAPPPVDARVDGPSAGADARAFDQRLVSPDRGPYECAPGEVFPLSNCVPTDQFFRCGPPPGPPCDPEDDSTCELPSVCDGCAATAHPVSSMCFALCVPGPPQEIVGPLRITPTSGIAGQPVELTIHGANFTIGAMYWSARIDGQTFQADGTDHACALKMYMPFIPPSPGVYAVEVSQYAGQPPWVLAGFYVASGGVPIDPDLIQPGYPCGPGQTCLEAPPYSCGCVAGRCQCQ